MCISDDDDVDNDNNDNSNNTMDVQRIGFGAWTGRHIHRTEFKDREYMNDVMN